MSGSYYFIPSSFSIRNLRPSQEVLVLSEQQMLLYQFIDIQEDATVIIEGEIVIL